MIPLDIPARMQFIMGMSWRLRLDFLTLNLPHALRCPPHTGTCPHRPQEKHFVNVDSGNDSGTRTDHVDFPDAPAVVLRRLRYSKRFAPYDIQQSLYHISKFPTCVRTILYAFLGVHLPMCAAKFLLHLLFAYVCH